MTAIPAPTPEDLAIDLQRRYERWEPTHGEPEMGDSPRPLIRRLVQIEQKLAQVEQKAESLQAFKDWVHKYLDDHGVPYHPPGPHGAEGCRIGDRMDWLMAKLAAAENKIREQACQGS